MDTVILTQDVNPEMRAEDPEEDTPRGGQGYKWLSDDIFEKDVAATSCTAEDAASLLLFPRFVQPQDQPFAQFCKKMTENNVSHG